jgi:hypothetical protein
LDNSVALLHVIDQISCELTHWLISNRFAILESPEQPKRSAQIRIMRWSWEIVQHFLDASDKGRIGNIEIGMAFSQWARNCERQVQNWILLLRVFQFRNIGWLL